MHHAFWRFADPAHPRHEPGHPLAGALRAFYRRLDARLGRLLESFSPEVHVIVASDHGAQALQGGFAINDWLRDQGLLALRHAPGGPRPFEERLVDFAATRVWAWGGYYARLFVNLKGREPQGLVEPADYEPLLRKLTADLAALPGPDGTPLGSRVVRPRDLAPDGAPQGDWPDLMVYVGDLRYRAVASVGNPSLFTLGNDTGPDDANHAMQGVFLHRGPGIAPGRRDGLRLLDVAGIIASALGVPYGR